MRAVWLEAVRHPRPALPPGRPAPCSARRASYRVDKGSPPRRSFSGGDREAPRIKTGAPRARGAGGPASEPGAPTARTVRRGVGWRGGSAGARPTDQNRRATGAPAGAARLRAAGATGASAVALAETEAGQQGSPRANRGPHGADCAPWGGMAWGVRGGEAPGSKQARHGRARRSGAGQGSPRAKAWGVRGGEAPRIKIDSIVRALRQ